MRVTGAVNIQLVFRVLVRLLWLVVRELVFLVHVLNCCARTPLPHTPSDGLRRRFQVLVCNRWKVRSIGYWWLIENHRDTIWRGAEVGYVVVFILTGQLRDTCFRSEQPGQPTHLRP